MLPTYLEPMSADPGLDQSLRRAGRVWCTLWCIPGYDSIVSGASGMREWPKEWLRLNAVCPYYTMFPLEFPLSQLQLYPDVRRVLDPFCGRGTTLYAARLASREAVGSFLRPHSRRYGARRPGPRIHPDPEAAWTAFI
jgi:hypothetical protein